MAKKFKKDGVLLCPYQIYINQKNYGVKIYKILILKDLNKKLISIVSFVPLDYTILETFLLKRKKIIFGGVRELIFRKLLPVFF